MLMQKFQRTKTINVFVYKIILSYVYRYLLARTFVST